MFNTNRPLNNHASISKVDWSALADTWMQQREQQAQWQQAAPPPPPPPPPPPQFLLGPPPIPPPGPPPMGMTFPPLPPSQVGIAPHHHQLQVGSNTTQESLTMTNVENSPWRQPPPPPLPPPPPPPPPSIIMTGSGLPRRANTNNNQPLFPIQSEMTSSFAGHKFWPSSNTGQQATPLPVPPPVPSQQSQTPSQFPTPPFQPPPVDKRMMNPSFNTSIPSLMEIPSSYGQNPVPPPIPVPAATMVPVESTMNNVPISVNANAKRRKIPAWLRDELGRIEKEKEKKLRSSNTNNLSMNDHFSKSDDDNDYEDNENDTDDQLFNKSTLVLYNADDNDSDNEDSEQNDHEEPTSTIISSTPIVTRRSRFDEDKLTEQQFNVSVISKRPHSPLSPSYSTTTFTEEDQIDKEEQFMIKLRRTLTELLLEVTNEELTLIAKEIYQNYKAESSKPVIRRASGLSSLIQSFSGTDSDDEDGEAKTQSTVDTTVISKSPIRTPVKQDHASNNLTKSTNKSFDDDNKSNKHKNKKCTKEKSSISSSSHDHKTKRHHHKKHRRRSSSLSSSSSSSSSNLSQSRSQKKKRTSNYDQYSEHNKSKKYDDRRRKR